jgi:hypothetical protein
MQVITLVLVQIFTIDNILGSPVLMPGRVVDSSASIPFLNRPSRSMQSTASQMYLERTSPLNTCSVRQQNRLIHLPALGSDTSEQRAELVDWMHISHAKCDSEGVSHPIPG